MKIQYCSDLHLELRQNLTFILRNPLEIKGDILILAGDIIPFCKIESISSFFDTISLNYKKVFWLPGNHEYFGSDIQCRSGSFCETIRPNVYLLNNYVVEIENVRFLFSTLWSQISLESSKAIEKTLFDYKQIKRGDLNLTVEHSNQLHKDAIVFLESELAKKTDKETIVISHHVPTFYNYPEQFKENPYREGFATEISELIIDTGIQFWLFGHHHENVPSFKINQTTLLTNQLGYLKYKKNTSFRRDAFFEI